MEPTQELTEWTLVEASNRYILDKQVEILLIISKEV